MRDLLVVFALDDQRYALPLAGVERSVRAVAVTALPQAPDIVLGVVNLRGRVIPVINLRRRFRRVERPIALGDQLLIVRTPRLTVALAVDAVAGVLAAAAEETVAMREILPELTRLDGIVMREDGLILIQDLDRLLSLTEETALHAALEET